MIYYTNFEICNIKWFMGEAYMKFFDYIDQIGGIYTGRWGDAPIRYIGVQMLMNGNEKFDFSQSIPYRHGRVREIEKQLKFR